MAAHRLSRFIVIIVFFVSFAATPVDAGWFSFFTAPRVPPAEIVHDVTITTESPSYPTTSDSPIEHHHTDSYDYVWQDVDVPETANVQTPSGYDGEDSIITSAFSASSSCHCPHPYKDYNDETFANAADRSGIEHSYDQLGDFNPGLDNSSADQASNPTDDLMATIPPSMYDLITEYLGLDSIAIHGAWALGVGFFAWVSWGLYKRSCNKDHRIIALEDVVKARNADLKSRDALLESLHSEVERLKRSSLETARKLEEQCRKTAFACKQNERAYQELNDKDGEIDAFELTLQDKEDEIRELNDLLSVAASSVIHVRARNTELEQLLFDRKLDVVIDSLTSSFQEPDRNASQATEQFELMCQERDASHSELSVMSTLLKSAQEEFALAKKETSVVREQAEEARVQAAAVYVKDLATVRKSLEELQGKFDAGEKTAKTLREERDEAKSEVSSITARMKVTQSELELAKKDRQGAREEAKKFLAEASVVYTKNLALRDSLEELEEEAEAMKETARVSSEEKDVALAEISTLTVSLDSVTKELAFSMEQTRVARKQAGDAGAKAKAIHADNVALRKELMDLEKEVADALNIDNGAFEDLQAQFEEEKAKNAELVRLLAESEQALTAAKTAVLITPPPSATLANDVKTFAPPSASSTLEQTPSDEDSALQQSGTDSDSGSSAVPTPECLDTVAQPQPTPVEKFRDASQLSRLSTPPPAAASPKPALGFTLNVPYAKQLPECESTIFAISKRPTNIKPAERVNAVKSGEDDESDTDDELVARMEAARNGVAPSAPLALQAQPLAPVVDAAPSTVAANPSVSPVPTSIGSEEPSVMPAVSNSLTSNTTVTEWNTQPPNPVAKSSADDADDEYDAFFSQFTNLPEDDNSKGQEDSAPTSTSADADAFLVSSEELYWDLAMLRYALTAIPSTLWDAIGFALVTFFPVDVSQTAGLFTGGIDLSGMTDLNLLSVEALSGYSAVLQYHLPLIAPVVWGIINIAILDISQGTKHLAQSLQSAQLDLASLLPTVDLSLIATSSSLDTASVDPATIQSLGTPDSTPSPRANESDSSDTASGDDDASEDLESEDDDESDGEGFNRSGSGFREAAPSPEPIPSAPDANVIDDEEFNKLFDPLYRAPGDATTPFSPASIPTAPQLGSGAPVASGPAIVGSESEGSDEDEETEDGDERDKESEATDSEDLEFYEMLAAPDEDAGDSSPRPVGSDAPQLCSVVPVASGPAGAGSVASARGGELPNEKSGSEVKEDKEVGVYRKVPFTLKADRNIRAIPRALRSRMKQPIIPAVATNDEAASTRGADDSAQDAHAISPMDALTRSGDEVVDDSDADAEGESVVDGERDFKLASS